MAGGIKGITVEIGGDTGPLNKALQDSNKQANSLQSELRQVDKALKLDPNNVTLVSQKQKILTEEIEATKDKLDVLKEAQAQVKAQYKAGEIDEGQYRAFQRELEGTKQKLSSLKDEKASISVIHAAFGTVKDKVQEVTEKLQPLITGIGKVASAAKEVTAAGIETVGKAVDAAGTALKVYAAAAAAAGAAAVGLAVKGASAADDINTLATQTGLSTDQIQKFQYASELIDVPLDTLTGSMAKLTKNMSTAQGGSGAAAEAFSALGVSITDQNGQLRNNQDVFNDAIAALGTMTNETERDALAMSIFGKSAQDLNPLIEGGADALAALGDSAASAGLILSQEALGHLNEFQDSLDLLKANASASGNILAGVFSGALKESTDVIGQAIPSITGMVAGMFSGDNGTAAQGELSNSLIDIANQLIANMATQIPQFLAGFNGIIISLVTALTTILPTAISTLLPTILTGFTNLILGLIPQIPILLPIIINAGLQLFTGLLNALNQIIPPLMAMLPQLINDVGAMLIKNLPVIIDAGFQLLISLITGIVNCLPNLITQVIALIPVMVQSLIDNLPALIQAGIQLIVALAVGLPKAIPEIIKALPEIIMAIIKGFAEVDWLDVGVQILKGIADGLLQGLAAIGDIIKKVANSIVNKFKDILGIHSPSTLFRDMIGKNLAAGVGVGFTDEMPNVNKTMQEAMPTLDPAASIAGSSGKGGAGQSLLDKLDEVKAAVTASGNIYLDDVKVSKGLASSSDKQSGQRQWLTERGVFA